MLPTCTCKPEKDLQIYEHVHVLIVNYLKNRNFTLVTEYSLHWKAHK